MGIIKNNPTPEDIAALRDRCSGKKGDGDSESVLARSADEEDQGFVTVMSARGADIARIIDRCGSQILWFHEEGEGECVDLRISTDVFRGIEYAFTPVDKEKKPFPGRENIKAETVGQVALDYIKGELKAAAEGDGIPERMKKATNFRKVESAPPETDDDLPLWKKQVKKSLAKKKEKASE